MYMFMYTYTTCTTLQEAVEAYKNQNKFLSSEIVELNALRTDDEEALHTLTSKCHELEAEYYRTESKYMVLLHETQQPQMGECGVH